MVDADIERAADIIRRGGLVAFPTETVYGLGANALDAAAVDRIYAAKGRPATSPLIVHVDSIAMARTIVRDWPDPAEQLARRFWPGPLTLILHKLPIVPDRVTAGLDTVGVRVPSHPVALSLIRAASAPIAAPSANRFTQLSPTTAEHVRNALGDTVDLVLDGGPTDVGIESTVLALANANTPQLLRPGMISRKEIEAIIGPVEFTSATGEAHVSPGLHPRHYSPRTPIILASQIETQRGACIWWKTEPRCERSVRMPADPAGYAKCLYKVLHALDHEGWEFIAIETVPEDDAWAGIRDRLNRAAAREEVGRRSRGLKRP
jgi:L-threonylcarbamoyladenylate synthase